MNTLELPDIDGSIEYVLQSALLLRTAKVETRTVLEAIDIARELAGEGAKTPPVGFLFDLAAIASGGDHLQGLPELAAEKSLFRRYDDYVLGRLYGDRSLQRAGYSLSNYKDRDRRKALSYLAQRVSERGKLPGAHLNPAAFKLLAPETIDQQMQRTWDQLFRDGLSDRLRDHLTGLCDRMRVAGALVGVEDIFELEQQLALRPLSERVALRHAWQASEFFRAAMPKDRPAAPRTGREVATRIEDEDQYPVGGYSSLANRGSMESLLHSQLAYMEEAESPDLFDVKFLRNELLFFARDENTFYRRRKTILIRLDSSLKSARIKDAKLGWQRLTLACGMVLCAVRLLDEWLSDHALNWVVITDDAEGDVLAEERELFRVALPELVAGDRLTARRLSEEEFAEYADTLRQRSELHVAEFSVNPPADSASDKRGGAIGIGDTNAFLRVDTLPQLWLEDKAASADRESACEWTGAAQQLIQSWL